ncbi:hypothetical protein AMAG_18547 [Allomyces macrogynus ATCC 38327]|uniref:Uncharacterized protein n=1 Tax=Allomyces macrogynus (strain ATCC 38327) TaxID=578462 RepID=A0A0L0SDJ1_ALLM3|nr:hypothetical protein AMAG_18547 [Allomyces macrogynus ATCC 38327]|eukprot:KNE60497.1 hypothetical protein AMAG_18547 [Allomyces macrogynus ATCC 38327]
MHRTRRRRWDESVFLSELTTMHAILVCSLSSKLSASRFGSLAATATNASVPSSASASAAARWRDGDGCDMDLTRLFPPCRADRRLLDCMQICTENGKQRTWRRPGRSSLLRWNSANGCGGEIGGQGKGANSTSLDF